MTVRAYRPGVCALCLRPDGHPCHAVAPRPPLWKRLLRLAWPSWIWGEPAGNHAYVPRDPTVRAGETVAALRLRIRHDQRRRRSS